MLGFAEDRVIKGESQNEVYLMREAALLCQELVFGNLRIKCVSEGQGEALPAGNSVALV
jgi:hypothetical protein